MVVIFFGVGLFVANTSILAASPKATRFVMIRPADSPAGTAMTVEIQALDSAGKVDAAYQGGVTLAVTGKATGAGLVKMVNGKGLAKVNDMVAENIHLSLSDTLRTGLNASSAQDVAFTVVAGQPLTQAPPTSAASGSGTQVQFAGVAFPKAVVTIVSQDQTRQVQVFQKAVVAADGMFSGSMAGVSGGNSSFGIVATDPDGRVTPVKQLNFATPENAQMNKNLVLAPTLGVFRSVVAKGEALQVTGYAEPNRDITLYLDGQGLNLGIKSGADGRYRFDFDTTRLSLHEHVAITRIRESDGRESDASLQLRFVVTGMENSDTDFNHDGKVDISDWSIFLYRWNSNDPALRASVDLNHDGNVDISDFSIFIRTMHS
jgi:hypothetical protein